MSTRQGGGGVSVAPMLIMATSTALSSLASAPLQRAKLILQTQEASLQISPSNPKFRGLLDILRRVPREQGFLSLWRGNVVAIVSSAAHKTVAFALYDAVRSSLPGRRQPGPDLAGNLAKGAIAGVLSVLLYPLGFARTRLAADLGSHSSRQFTGAIHCLRSIRPSGWYRGLPAALAGLVLYRAIYFGAFETCTQWMRADGATPSKMRMFLAAQAVTLAAGIAAYPLDTLTRRLMMQSGRPDVLYRSATHACATIFAREGIAGFYRGVSVTILSGVMGACALLLYDELKKRRRQ